MGQTLWNQKNYLLNIPYLIATNINEYDIKQANINILYSMGIIDIDYYTKLSNMPKIERQIDIGYLIQRNAEIQDILYEGLAKYKKLFFEANGFDDNDILSIKNDAIFVLAKQARQTTFNNVEFVLKNNYSSYMKVLSNLEIYFKSDMINNQIILDIKGIGDETLKLHQDYMCTWIADILYGVEIGDLEQVINNINNFYRQYIERKLPVGYYRTFDSESKYYITFGDLSYSIMEVQPQDLPHINISSNLNLIRDIYRYVTEIYLSRIK